MSGGGAPPVTGTGPLCDVLAVLRTKCDSCHSNPPSPRSIPMSLVSYADLVAPAPSDPTQTTAAMCLERMQDKMAPMPPAPASPATASDVATLQAWIDAGMPSTCDAPAAGSAGASGMDGAGGSGVVANPYDSPVVCTSNKQWTGGNDGSANMHPGGTCISCHSSGGGEEEGPRFAFAGTVYPTAHEPDDCNGVNGSTAMAQVIVTDANGATITMSVNSVGNFSYTSRSTVALPYHAKVVANGQERAMSAAQQSGDCNSCHTETGANDAPGRIMAP
jgi:hypothetical protein